MQNIWFVSLKDISLHRDSVTNRLLTTQNLQIMTQIISRPENISRELELARARRAARLAKTQMKSLNEEVNDIMTAKATKAMKTESLVKLGLTDFDIEVILNMYKPKRAPRTRNNFTFGQLTFGVEIECYNCNRENLINEGGARSLSIHSEGYNHDDGHAYYKIVSDGSIIGREGNEVVSPIFKGNNGLNSLKSLCDALAAVGARVNRSTGLHVHIGAEKFSDAHFLNILRNYQKLETAIDSFMPNSRRGDNNGYCKSLTGLRFDLANSKEQAINICGTRYRKVNAIAYLRHKTIEFRQHSGTTEYEKISNWISFLAKLVQYSENNVLTDNVATIEEIPFLTRSEKQYFIERRAALN